MDVVYPGAYVALRTPSDLHKLVELQPHTNIFLGKYGTFSTDAIIGRPYHLTYEILESGSDSETSLRIVPPTEQYAHIQEDEDSEERTPVPEELLEAANGTDPSDTVDSKSAFTVAKYELKRSKRAKKQFTVLPLDPTLLSHWLLHEKRVSNSLELRPETLAQLMGWANVHSGGDDAAVMEETGDFNRWLVVDESGGVVVAAMAERMGILFKTRPADAFNSSNGTAVPECTSHTTHPSEPQDSAMSAISNTITLVHAHSQPNLSSLSYFNYDLSAPDLNHPLYSHLHTLSWLQLVQPGSDSLYTEPHVVSDTELASWKFSKRGAYYRKRRRWQRVRQVVDNTRAGGFSGLVVAAVMEPASILRHLVPLVRGGGQIVVYTATAEPLLHLQDLYSTLRKTAWLEMSEAERADVLGGDDFPTDPSALLATTVYTVRARPWQVLPGRTHPVMHDKGGAEGFVFIGTRVVKSVEKVMARGKHRGSKRRRVDAGGADGDESVSASVAEA